MLALAFGFVFALGWPAVRWWLPVADMRPRWAARLLEACLAFGLGAGLASSLHFLLLVAGAGGRFVPIAVEVVAAAAGIALLLRSGARGAGTGESRRSFSGNSLLAPVFGVVAILAIATFADATIANPHGAWDAWSIWNVRARFLLGEGDAWRNAYSPLLVRTHPDYPLLLSSFIARCWKYTGGTPPAVPIVTAFLFLSATVGLLVSCAALARSAGAGWLAGIVLLASPGFVLQAPAQYSDIPLSFYVLASLGLLLIAEGRGRIITLAGLFAALAAWTKNEGLLFFGALVAALVVVRAVSDGWRPALREVTWFLAGAAPVLLITAGFKLCLAPAADPLVRQSFSEALGRLSETERHWKIAKAFWAEARMFGSGWTHPSVSLMVLAAALRFRIATRQRSWVWMASMMTVIVLVGYFAVYAITPSGLDWHLNTSLVRLYVQLWPPVLLLAFVVLRSPEEFLSRSAVTKQKKRRKRG